MTVSGNGTAAGLLERTVGHEVNLDIQVLRAVAIGMVYLQHMAGGLIEWPSTLQHVLIFYCGGGGGVDLFFVISGFVIARSLLPKLRAAQGGQAYLHQVITFLVRRFWRLQPAAWLWIAIPILLSVTYNRFGAFFTMAGNLPAAFSAVVAVNNLRSAMLLYATTPLQIFFPYWSLSLEEQFYLLLPVLAFVFRRRLHWVMFLLLAYQFAAPWEPWAINTRPGALAMGVLLAMGECDPAYALAEPNFLSASGWIRAAFLSGLVFLIGGCLSALLDPLHSIRYGLQAILSGMLVYAASFNRGYIMAPGVIRRICEWVGARSYAIYLIHVPAFALTREVLHHLQSPNFVPGAGEAGLLVGMAVVFTCIFADLTYRLVETPCRRYGRSIRIAPVPAAAGV